VAENAKETLQLSHRWETQRLAECPTRAAPAAAFTIAILPSFPEGEIAHATAIPDQIAGSARVQGLAELFYVIEGRGQLWRASGNVETVTELEPGVCVTITPGIEYQFRATRHPMTSLVATTARFDPGENWLQGERRYWNARGEAPNRVLRAGPWTSTRLKERYDYLAPDTSEIRLLPSFDAGGLAHCRLPAGAVSSAVRHKSVKEIWYILAGSGELWRGERDDEETVEIAQDTCLTIPSGVSFQFRALGESPLDIMIGTFPAWPGPQEAEPVKGKW
jgi:mannose-6-phosphate isomerase-like protein (cupin superfamily)